MKRVLSMKIYLAGKRGLLGSALCRYYQGRDVEFIATSSAEVDLRDYGQIERFLQENRPDVMILSAARHGGIESYRDMPLETYRDNLAIGMNALNASAESGVRQVVYIGASCVYSEGQKGPLTEDMLFTGPVQKATEPYGMAKAAGMKLCEYYNRCRGLRYISVLPPNLYGDGVGYKVDMSSVLPGMMDRFREAAAQGKKTVMIWGSGNARREFLHVQDLVRAIDTVINSDFSEPYINISGPEMYTINEVAQIMKEVCGFEGEIVRDMTKPEGAQREKLSDERISALGWRPAIGLFEGLLDMYRNLYGDR